MFEHPCPVFAFELFRTLTPSLLRATPSALMASSTALLATTTTLAALVSSVALSTLFWFLGWVGF